MIAVLVQDEAVAVSVPPGGTDARRRDRPDGLSRLLARRLPRSIQASAGVSSLEGDGGAGALEGGLGLLRDVLGNLLQNHLRSPVNDILGLLQAEAREGAHLLDDLNLLVAYGCLLYTSPS